MSLRRILATALRIVQQFSRDGRTLVLILVAPLAVLLLLNSALSGKAPEVTLGVVADATSFSPAAFSQMENQLKTIDRVHVVMIDRDKVDQDLREGKADGVLLTPQETDPPTSLVLRVEGSDPATAQRLRLIVEQAAKGFQPNAPAEPASVRTEYLYGGKEYTETDALAPYFIGLFDFLFVFLLSSVAFLRERSQGTMERVLVSPLSRSELVVGYLLGFTIFALLQALMIMFFVIGVLHIHYAGSLVLLLLVTLLLTIGAINLGIFTSVFAKNELQVIQFVPLLLVPQILLGGLFFPVRSLPVVLKQLAYLFPVTYANFALKDVMVRGFGLAGIWTDVVFLVAFAVLMVGAAVLSLGRRRAFP